MQGESGDSWLCVVCTESGDSWLCVVCTESGDSRLWCRVSLIP